MIVDCLVVSPFEENCYVVGCEKTKACLVIDAGDEPERIMGFVASKGYKLQRLINTHAHVDHISAVAAIQEKAQVPFFLHSEEKRVLEDLLPSQMVYNFGDRKIPRVDETLEENKIYRIGELEYKVIETPGHTPGGVSFLFDNAVFVGDSLFAGSIGRTDLPGGSMPTLMRSIKDKLLQLDESLTVYCGHGPTTTIGKEKRTNPFVIYDDQI